MTLAITLHQIQQKQYIIYIAMQHIEESSN